MFYGNAIVGPWSSPEAARADLTLALDGGGYVVVPSRDPGNSSIACLYELGESCWLTADPEVLVPLTARGRRAIGAEASYEDVGNVARRAVASLLRVDDGAFEAERELGAVTVDRPWDAGSLIEATLVTAAWSSRSGGDPSLWAVDARYDALSPTMIFYEPARRFARRDLDYAFCAWLHAAEVRAEATEDGGYILRCSDGRGSFWHSREVSSQELEQLTLAIEASSPRHDP